MSLRLITPPAAELGAVVSLDEFKLHTGIEFDDRDADTQIKLTAAIRKIEAETGRALLQSTWTQTLRQWPVGDCIELGKMQVQSVASITYMDSSGATNTVSSSRYRLVGAYDKVACPSQVAYGAKVVLRYGMVWPNGALENGEPITITFVCGWDVALSVPFELRAAVMLEAAHFYRNRESIIVGNNVSVDSLPLARGVASLISQYMDTSF